MPKPETIRKNVPIAQNFANKLATLITLKNQNLPTFLTNLQNLMNGTLHFSNFYFMYIELFNGMIANVGQKFRGIGKKIESFKASVRRCYRYCSYSQFQLYRTFGINLEQSYKRNWTRPPPRRLYHRFLMRLRRINPTLALTRKIDYKYQYNEQIIGQAGFISGALPFGVMLNNIDDIISKIRHDLRILLQSSIVNNMFAISVKFHLIYETMDFSTNTYMVNLEIKKASSISNSVNVQWININNAIEGYLGTDNFGNPRWKKGLREIFDSLATSIAYHIYQSNITISIHKP